MIVSQLFTSALQLVGIELHELAEQLLLALRGNAHSCVCHIYPQHADDIAHLTVGKKVSKTEQRRTEDMRIF